MNVIREAIVAVLAIGAIAGGTTMATAAPGLDLAPVKAIEKDPLLDHVRLYCRSNYTGEFLYWGPCRSYYGPRYYVRRSYYRPRYYRRYW